MKKKIFTEKFFLIIIIIILLILISGCKGKKEIISEIRSGTQGIIFNLMKDTLPEKIYVDEGSETIFDVIFDVKNKGAYPQPEDAEMMGSFGKMFISGYDPKIISFEPNIIELNSRNLEGKSTLNPNGGEEIITFTGKILADNMNVEKYEANLLATACYTYQTIAVHNACIEPNPYITNKGKGKIVCEPKDVALENQGAPIAITKIEEQPFAGKMQFKIILKNVGNGDAIKQDSFDKCGSSEEAIDREDLDEVYLDEVKIGTNPLECSPFAGANAKGKFGYITLINGEGSIICELQKTEYADANTAYTTPMTIKLIYGYRNSVGKELEIRKR